MINLECKPDERLVMTLGIRRKDIKHHNDKGAVCNTLKKGEGQIGLIDEDPKSAQPKYLTGLSLISDDHGIKELRDKNNNVILILKPKLEDWFIDACERSNIDLRSFGLASTPNQLHREINTKLDKFDAIVKKLLEVRNRKIIRLQSLLKSVDHS